MTEHERILDKIRRLLRLGESSNPNEAATAIAQANRLMAEHRISASLLHAKEAPEHIRSSARGDMDPLDDMRRKAVWKGALSSVLARANCCRTVWYGATLHILGRDSDVQTVRYLYDYCVSEVERLTKLHAYGRGRTFVNEFKHGCVEAIREKLAEAKKALHADLYKEAAAKGTGSALVLLDNALARVNERDTSVQAWIDRMKLGKFHDRSRYDKSARDLGRRVGATINLDRGRTAALKTGS